MFRNLLLLLAICYMQDVQANEPARRLFDDLLTNYNKLVRPVKNHTETLLVFLKLKLSQLLDVHEKDQIMKTNVWLHQEWYDSQLRWNPDEYNGIKSIYVPAELIWLPDIVLYNTAGGNYQITIMTKATVQHDGLVKWAPPAVYQSMCEMNMAWFPFDTQHCVLKFGAWSHSSLEISLVHYDRTTVVNEFIDDLGHHVWRVENSIDLTGYHPHVEWDVLEVPGERHSIVYGCCSYPYVDVTYYLLLRRKTLFYTVNLIVPCVGISFLTVFVFYLPADSGEKVVMCISILISLNVFFLLLVELIPATSTVMPLIAQYLLFTMVLVTFSVAVTVMTLNVHHRSPSTHRMPEWVRRLFLYTLPPILGMQRPTWVLTDHANASGSYGYFSNQKPAQNSLCNDKRSKSAGELNSVYRIAAYTNNVHTNYHRHSCQGSEVIINMSADASDGSDDERTPLRKRFSIRTDDRAIQDAWEKRPSLCELLETRDACRKAIVKNGDQLSAIRFVASSVGLIVHKIRREAQEKEIIQSWSFAAMVIDRFFLYIFSIACVAGTCGIILQAPSIYDTRKALPK